MTTPMLYIAGPYRGMAHDWRSYMQIDRHIANAREAAAWCATHGLDFFCPHLHSAHFEVIAPTATDQYWYALDMRFLEICTGMLLLEGWERSTGARRELAVMTNKGRPSFVFPSQCQDVLDAFAVHPEE